MVNIKIPGPLRKLTGGKNIVQVDAHSVEEAIKELLKSYPGLKERITDENGNVREFLNIYVNEQDIRFMDNLQTKVKEGDVILLIPAIAGGA